MERRLADLAAAVGGVVEGDPERLVSGVAPLDRAGPGDLSFLANRRYREQARRSAAGAILATPGESLPGRTIIRVAQPYLALARLMPLFAPPPPARTGVHAAAILGDGVRLGADPEIHAGVVIGADARLGDRVTLHPGVVLGRGVEVGDDTTLHPNVSVYAGVRIGRRVVVHAGAVLGADGFGYALDERGATVKVPQLGGVVIEDDVEIGACTCVDRGTMGDTRVRRGARLDNLVQVAHNVDIGEQSMLAAQSGVSGSTRLGARVTMAGQSGIVGHVVLGDGARVAAKAAVTKSVAPGMTVAGIPAVDIGRWKRSVATLSRLSRSWRGARARGADPAPGAEERDDD